MARQVRLLQTDDIDDDDDVRSPSPSSDSASFIHEHEAAGFLGTTTEDSSSHPAPKEVYNWRPYVLALSAAMGSAMFGYDTAFIGGTIALPSFAHKFGLEDATGNALAGIEARIVSTFQVGCFFGSILVYYFNEFHGRRNTLILAGLLFDCGAIMQLLSNGNLDYIYLGRGLTGLAVGSSSLVIPVYISECAPPAIRGRLVGIFEIVLQSFLVVGFWVNYGVNEHISGLSDTQWRIPVSLQLVPGTLLVIAMSFQPESPRWLIRAGKTSQARKVLSYIRNLPADHEYVVWEVESVLNQIEHESYTGADGSLKDKLKSIMLPGKRNRLILGCSMMILQNLSGTNALNYYSTTIFRSIGFSGTSVGLLATGVYGFFKCITTIFFTFFVIERIGRRNSLIYGGIGTMVAMFYLAFFGAVSGSFDGHAERNASAYVAIFMVYFFAVTFTLSWSGIPWIFAAEVFPASVRSVCVSMTTSSQWVGQFMIVYSTPYLMENIKWGTFLVFGISLFFGVVFVFLWVPETKGMTLEEMDIMFELETTDGREMREQAEAIIAHEREVLTMSDRQTVGAIKLGDEFAV
ncbi:general substrate transporter [Myxozyma melibiosi]|uniref:Quinate transporter n=1 Tax=Myxozyma melibiosi TaxID=54550 RepID=A0ABR1FCP6_9ASCO